MACNSNCTACPFSTSEEAEQTQNWGCLPSPFEILEMKRTADKNWPCHEDETRICAGFVSRCRELGLDYKSGPLASYQRWYHEGAEAA